MENMTRIATITHKGNVRTCNVDDYDATVAAMVTEFGPWEAASTIVVDKERSDWTRQVADPEAAERITAQRTIMADRGHGISSDVQLYATATRLADVGYATQAARKADHESLSLVRDAAAQLTETIENERRRDIECTADDIASSLVITRDHQVKILDGYRLGSTGLRGLLSRIDSPAFTYASALGDRDSRVDASILATILERELTRQAGTKFKIRVRESIGDVYAAVSPSYGVADAPTLLPMILAELPSDAKASWSYDAASTSWQIRVEVFTPTPTTEHAVGEPFRGYSAFSGRDNGTSRLRGGGGIVLIICLNASEYVSQNDETSRVHRGNVLYDIPAMVRAARASIDTLALAWGTARETVVQAPALIPIEEALPGFFRAMLSERKSEYVGVLPGSREIHVKALAEVFPTERRNGAQLVKADFAQALTRYAQKFEHDVQRNAEKATGLWLASERPLVFAAK